MKDRDLALKLLDAHDRDTESFREERHRILAARQAPGDQGRVVSARLEPCREVRDVDRRAAHVQARDDT